MRLVHIRTPKLEDAQQRFYHLLLALPIWTLDDTRLKSLELILRDNEK